jgi:hypothetical protein
VLFERTGDYNEDCRGMLEKFSAPRNLSFCPPILSKTKYNLQGLLHFSSWFNPFWRSNGTGAFGLRAVLVRL